tara:strand:+ start:1379 stop:2098 length:720 start_codon:yes stop_codon:yes gene_type:complete
MMDERKIDPNKEIRALEEAKVFKRLSHPDAAKTYLGEALWYLQALPYHYDRFLDLACNEKRQLAMTHCVPLEAEVVGFIMSLHSLMEGVPYGAAVCLDLPVKDNKPNPKKYGWSDLNEYFKGCTKGHEHNRLQLLIKTRKEEAKEQYDLLSELANTIKHRHPIRLSLPKHLQGNLHYRMTPKKFGESDLVFKEVIGYESQLNAEMNVIDTLESLHDVLTYLYLDIRDELIRLMWSLPER